MAKLGPAAFVPSDEQREVVENLSGLGLPQSAIARTIGLSPPTLRKHFRDELNLGAERLHSKLALTAAGMALSGDKTMLIFILKTKFRWSDAAPPEPPKDARKLIAGDGDPEVDDRGDPGT